MADRWTMRPQQSENLSDSPQGVLRLNERELLFGKAAVINENTNERVVSVRAVTS